jgi:hypothetical protein
MTEKPSPRDFGLVPLIQTNSACSQQREQHTREFGDFGKKKARLARRWLRELREYRSRERCLLKTWWHPQATSKQSTTLADVGGHQMANHREF